MAQGHDHKIGRISSRNQRTDFDMGVEIRSAPKQRERTTNRNQFNHRTICATVDGMGGSEHNDLQTRVFNGCRSGMGRQALANPQNWVARCPGSLLTNLSDPHPRAGLERPTSADEVSFEMRSRLDHPRSHHSDGERPLADWATLSSKGGSRQGYTKDFENWISTL